MTSGNVWAAIFITIVASTASSVGKALQKQATKHLPRFSLDEKVLRQYSLDHTWLAGLVSDVVGGIIQVFAFAMAPVSIVQPVSGVGLVGLAIYSHFFQKEKLQNWEWAAVAVTGLGTLGLGASSGGGDSDSDSDADAATSHPSALRMIFVLIMVGMGVSSLTKIRQRHRQKSRRPAMNKAGAAALYGLQAGGCFGLSASCCRTGFLMASRRWTWVPFGLASGVGLSSTGFVLQTRGLKEGSTVVVCTCVAVTSMVTGVLVGILGLGEGLPGSKGAVLTRLVSWVMILLGVVVLASGPGGARDLIATALQRLPPSAWKVLPVNLAVKVKNWATTRAGLPEVDTVSGGIQRQSHEPGTNE